MTHRPLRLSLKVGAVYDLALAGGILLGAEAVFRLMGYREPDSFLVRMSVLPLLVLPVLYWAASKASDLGVFKVPVLWARGFGGSFILAAAAVGQPEGLWVYGLIGLLDLAFFLVHLLLWRRPS